MFFRWFATAHMKNMGEAHEAKMWRYTRKWIYSTAIYFDVCFIIVYILLYTRTKHIFLRWSGSNYSLERLFFQLRAFIAWAGNILKYCSTLISRTYFDMRCNNDKSADSTVQTYSNLMYHNQRFQRDGGRKINRSVLKQ